MKSRRHFSNKGYYIFFFYGDTLTPFLIWNILKSRETVDGPARPGTEASGKNGLKRVSHYLYGIYILMVSDAMKVASSGAVSGY